MNLGEANSKYKGPEIDPNKILGTNIAHHKPRFSELDASEANYSNLKALKGYDSDMRIIPSPNHHWE